MENLKYADITGKIIGAAFEVIIFWATVFRRLFTSARWPTR